VHAGVAELVDAPDSKSGAPKGACRFEPDLRYQEIPAKLDNTLTEIRGPSRSTDLFYTNYYTNALGKGILHRFGGAIQHIGEHMRVGVQCDGDAGVAQHLGDDLGVRVLGEKQRSARVPQIVKAYLRQPCSSKEWLESVSSYVPAVQWIARL
jgi:hypothetical protein